MGLRKLSFQPLPDCAWGVNLRTVLSKKQWDYVRKDALSRSNGYCAYCGKKTDKLDAHEEWGFDEESKTQILLDVKPICKDCHSAVHINRTYIKGNPEKAEDHYIKVNGITYAQMKQDLKEANELQKKLNQTEFCKLDLTWLKRFTEK